MRKARAKLPMFYTWQEKLKLESINRKTERAKVDPTFRVYTMDNMEKILLTPQLQVGQLYYKRKLKTYNFIIFNLGTGVATNYNTYLYGMRQTVPKEHQKLHHVSVYIHVQYLNVTTDSERLSSSQV